MYGFIQYNQSTLNFPWCVATGKSCVRASVNNPRAYLAIKTSKHADTEDAFSKQITSSLNHHLCMPTTGNTYSCHDVLIHLNLRFSPVHCHIVPPQLNAARD